METNPNLDNALRTGFRYLNRFMLLMWDLGLGKMMNCWPDVGGRIYVLTQTGRKSGRQRRTPLNYAIVDGELYCLSGFGRGSDWYKNIKVNPQVEVWLPDGWWTGLAEDVNDPQKRLLLMRAVLIGSGFAAYLAGINPRKITDEELMRVTQTYKLLHIRRLEARTGPGGPGELSWVWPVLTFLLLPLVMRRRKR